MFSVKTHSIKLYINVDMESENTNQNKLSDLPDDLIYILIGNLISADWCITEEKCESSIEILTKLKNELSELNNRQELLDMVENGLIIVKRDLEAIKNTKKH